MVSSQNTIIAHLANGVAITFAFDFLVQRSTDLYVVLLNPDATEATPISFTVAGVGSNAGGTVTFIAAPGNGITVVIYRKSFKDQEKDYVPNDDFPAETHETALDRSILLHQEAQRDISKSIRIPSYETATVTELTKNFRKGRIIAFDEDGNLSALLKSQLIAEAVALAKTDVTEIVVDSGFTNVKSFGAVGNGVVDDTNALQSAITWAVLNRRSLFVPKGTYKITQPLVKSSEFYCPSIHGEGLASTVFNYSTITPGGACLEVIGGSGALCGAVIKGIQWVGNSNSTGILFDGQGGIDVEHCYFGLNNIGMNLWNRGGGAFTEFVQAYKTEFGPTCKIKMNFYQTNGVNSFHGSGMRQCYINEDAASVENCIQIGAGCLVYNAPLDVQIWKSNTTALIKSLGQSPTFHGTITQESNTAYQLVRTGDAPVFFVGGFVSLGSGNQNFFRNAYWCKAVVYQPDSSITPVGIRRIHFQTLAAGDNVLTDLGQLDGGSMYLISLSISGPSYYWKTLLIADSTPFVVIGPSLTIIGRGSEFNGSGAGAPAISVESVSGSRYLHIVNAGYSASYGVVVTLEEISAREYGQLV
jgi:hypothetical protein